MLLYYLDLAGVAVFSASGVLAARGRDLDVFGVLVVATITAIGGGTVRDLLLNRHPIFWITDPWYSVVIIVAAVLTIAYLHMRPPPHATLVVADALGLALFSLSGAQLAEAAHCPPLIIVFMGTVTGVTGGALRDVITAQVPLILRREIYATAAVVGIALYLVLRALDVSQPFAVGAGILTVAASVVCDPLGHALARIQKVLALHERNSRAVVIRSRSRRPVRRNDGRRWDVSRWNAAASGRT